jgi:hypothetical protein
LESDVAGFFLSLLFRFGAALFITNDGGTGADSVTMLPQFGGREMWMLNLFNNARGNR